MCKEACDRCKERGTRGCISGVFSVESENSKQDNLGVTWVRHHEISYFVEWKSLGLEAEVSIFKPRV